jgi:hypothetical protein
MAKRFYAFQELKQLVYEAGAFDLLRVVSGIKMAVQEGMHPQDAIASLRKWQPALFGEPRPKPSTKPTRGDSVPQPQTAKLKPKKGSYVRPDQLRDYEEVFEPRQRKPKRGSVPTSYPRRG